jgi:hypothetical protein
MTCAELSRFRWSGAPRSQLTGRAHRPLRRLRPPPPPPLRLVKGARYRRCCSFRYSTIVRVNAAAAAAAAAPKQELQSEVQCSKAMPVVLLCFCGFSHEVKLSAAMVGVSLGVAGKGLAAA